MKCCLIHEMLGCVYAHLVLKVGLRDLDTSFHISYLYIENICIFERLTFQGSISCTFALSLIQGSLSTCGSESCSPCMKVERSISCDEEESGMIFISFISTFYFLTNVITLIKTSIDEIKVEIILFYWKHRIQIEWTSLSKIMLYKRQP